MATKEQPKVAIVTGGGTGIGAAVAMTLADQGWHVVITGRRSATLAEVQVHNPDHIHPISGDMTDTKDVTRVFEEARSLFGRIDRIVHAAAVYQSAPVKDITDDQIEQGMAEYGMLLLVVRAAAKLLEPDGQLVLVSSFGGLPGMVLPKRLVYSSVKFAMGGAGEGYRQDCPGHRVVVVCFGAVDTAMGHIAGKDHTGEDVDPEMMLTPQEASQAIEDALAAPSGVVFKSWREQGQVMLELEVD